MDNTTMIPMSERDAHVLDLIFSGSASVTDMSSSSVHPDTTGTCPSAVAMNQLSSEIASRIRQHEASAIEQAEKGQLSEALQELDQAIQLCSDIASVYNNRAQVWRLLNRLDNAMVDLNRAIQLATPDQYYVLKNAHVQRGVIYKSQDNLDDAVREFQLASRFGSKIGKIAAVKENPFAQMCNEVMAQVMAQNHPIKSSPDEN